MGETGGSIVKGRLLLGALLGAGALIIGGIGVAQTTPSLPKSFYAASIKPAGPNVRDITVQWPRGRFTAVNVTVERLIDMAYGLRPEQLEGLPSWAKSQTYTIQAVMPPDMPELAPTETAQVNRQMLQSLLADRFGLKVHNSIQRLPVYEIVVAKGGPKLTPSNEINQDAHNPSPGVYDGGSSGPTKFVGVSLPFLGYFLSTRLGRMVIDKSGLTGRFDFTLNVMRWSPNPVAADSGAESGTPTTASLSDESIFSAMKEQLGLELKAARGPVTVWAVDHVEPPTPN